MPNYRATARQYAQRAGINPTLFERQINAESSFNPNSTSGAGAQGIAQIMPATARSWGVNPNNPNQALQAAAQHMADYLRAYHGDWSKALTAYNAGPGAVGRPLPTETQAYIRNILGGSSGRQAVPSGGSPSVPLTTSTVQLGQKTVTDTAGLARAKAGYVLATTLPGLKRAGNPLFASGLLSGTAPNPQDFQRQVTTSKIVSSTQMLGGGGVVGGSAQDVLQRAVTVSHRHPSYLWGGGHGSSPAPLGAQVDCSGFVSQALGVTPRVSGDFMRFGDAGRGRQITVWANSGHVLLQIGNRWFATSHSNPGGGAGEIAAPSAGYLSAFTPRHPRGQ